MATLDPKIIPLFQKTISNVRYFTPQIDYEGPEPSIIEVNENTIDSLPSTRFYFLNCKDKTFKVDAQCGKVMIENCTDCLFQFNGRITTHIIEAWNSSGLRLEIGSSTETIQLDNTDGVEITIPNPRHFGAIVHSHASGTKLKVGTIELFEVPVTSDTRPHSQYVVRKINESLVNEFMERSGIFPVYGTKMPKPAEKTEENA